MSDEEEARKRAKAKNLRPLLNLLPLLWRHKTKLAAAILALLSAAATTLLIPLAVREVIDTNFVANNPEISYPLMWAAGGVAVALALSSAFRFYFVMLLGERISTDLRKDVFSHLLSLDSSFFEKIKTGEIISRLSADVTLVRTILSSSISIALRNFLLMVGASVMLVITSPTLSSFVLVLIPLICLPLLGFGRLVRKLSRYAQDRLADTGAMAGEMLGAIQTVQSFTYEPIARSRFDETAESAYTSARTRIAARAFLVAVIITILFLAILFIFYQGSLSVLNQEMTAGLLGQFLLYALMAAGSMAVLGEVWGDLQLAAGAAERLFELLEEEPRITSPAHPLTLPTSGPTGGTERGTPQGYPTRGQIIFDSVSFAYPLRPSMLALNNFSATFEAQKMTALVGVSGAGKSTLFHLLNRFDDPQRGTITFDGVNIARLALEQLRGQLACVLQDPTLFSMSISDNILYANPHATPAQIEAAATAAAASEFIETLPEKYQTTLGERGVTLSGGQKQRVAIARALIRTAPVLLLDEATSALDTQNENLIQQALLGLKEQKTILVIAHRLTTVERADKILLMDKGQVVASGTHAELLESNELYRKLAKKTLQD